MNASREFALTIRTDALPARPVQLQASEAQRAALAERFALPAIHSLEAEISLEPDGAAVRGDGRLTAEFEQVCAVSGEPFRNRIDEALALRFVPASDRATQPDEEIELDANELDDIPFEGGEFDLGEAIAQSFALALDPYAEGPEGETARREAGIVPDDSPRGPLAEALAALKTGGKD